MISKKYREAFDRGYALGYAEGYSEGRTAGIIRMLKKKKKWQED